MLLLCSAIYVRSGGRFRRSACYENGRRERMTYDPVELQARWQIWLHVQLEPGERRGVRPGICMLQAGKYRQQTTSGFHLSSGFDNSEDDLPHMAREPTASLWQTSMGPIVRRACQKY